jgi:hypothetical protein
MKKYFFVILSFLLFNSINAADKDSTIYYPLPDSVKATVFMAEIKVTSLNEKKQSWAGIKTDAVDLTIRIYKKKRQFHFNTRGHEENLIPGWNTYTNPFKPMGISFFYDWQLNETYKLLIAQASDSALNFSLYSGYVFLPKENKWKWIGTIRVDKRWNTIQQPRFFYNGVNKQTMSVTTGQVWIQRSNGSWKNLKNEDLPNPIINWFGHIDSVQQRQIDIKTIEAAITSGKTDVKNNEQGVYYTMMKEGTGRLVSVNDTVTAFYKGYLFVNDSVFDQTREKPATFPLKRLIRGWQIGVPLCKVGGKIKLVIPSDLAYSIRTRAAKIPPNSILVFEIEVLDAKSPIAGN